MWGRDYAESVAAWVGAVSIAVAFFIARPRGWLQRRRLARMEVIQAVAVQAVQTGITPVIEQIESLKDEHIKQLHAVVVEQAELRGIVTYMRDEQLGRRVIPKQSDIAGKLGLDS